MLSPSNPSDDCAAGTMATFEPSRAAALARLRAVDPDAYAQTRNHHDGAVTRLSPYLTHGLLDLREVYQAVHTRHALGAQHKFVMELGWRAYWRHVWEHLGAEIYRSIHPGVLPDVAYQQQMPVDVLNAQTGIPVIDRAVSELYATGYLHNHARMWLASYLVHVRKVHWLAGAQWMLGYLLDGDIGSNHLSWQWVAGSGSSKPYLFNADNVSKFAPTSWHSHGSVIDISYEAMGRMASCPQELPFAGGARPDSAPLVAPSLQSSPPCKEWVSLAPPNQGYVDAATVCLSDETRKNENAVMNAVSKEKHATIDAMTSTTNLSMSVAMRNAISLLAGSDVWLMHPWSLGLVPDTLPADTLVVGVGITEAHRPSPWAPKRWSFVTQALLRQTPHLWWGEAAHLAHVLVHAKSIRWREDAHIKPSMDLIGSHLRKHAAPPQQLVQPESPLFEPVETYCASFSKWWRKTALLV